MSSKEEWEIDAAMAEQAARDALVFEVRANGCLEGAFRFRWVAEQYAGELREAGACNVVVSEKGKR